MWMIIIIINVCFKDIWFFIFLELDGLDVMNFDLDYFVVYVILEINYLDKVEGYGFIFMIGRGNEICVKVIEVFFYLVIN